MSEEELRRTGVMTRVAAGVLKLVKGAELLRVSYRQAKRLWRRYREKGAGGLVHGNAGRRSNRAKPEKFRRKVLGLVGKHYSGGPGERFGPTLAAEHLEKEHGMKVDRETLRRWMLSEGLWSRERRRKAYRQRRERKKHFGELVQMDGSFHDWLEGRGPRGCLINLVDDATGTTLARLGREETIWAAADALEAWIGKYGIPQALYTDWKNVYVRKPTPQESLRGETPVTQFGGICQRLGIGIIAASSPQAKGRVERSHGIHQDRLIKKMRLKKIANCREANRFLEEEYLAEHNARFALAPAEAADFYRPLEPGRDLRAILCLE
jgi:transposase